MKRKEESSERNRRVETKGREKQKREELKEQSSKKRAELNERKRISKEQKGGVETKERE